MNHCSIFIGQDDKYFKSLQAICALFVKQTHAFFSELHIFINLGVQFCKEGAHILFTITVKPVSGLVPHLNLIETSGLKLLLSAFRVIAIGKVVSRWGIRDLSS